ncbi:hypothetical protein jhhlp_004653 [Lomentospora prolificans]|uniref:Uncharacterized protein n=1 Tax=Lomentospora prolificans TaxID=41688 RepID=A0A2N3NC71_9PEZI|nr:hypothetical protein jhhlp_004653 [Lomentospora prolificans]
MDEKLNCEVATYAWIQENCPEFPFTHLIGFEFSDGAKPIRYCVLPKFPILAGIGAFEFHDDGTLTLTNWPPTCGVMIHENNGAPRVLRKKATYDCVDPYISDLLTFHDERFMAQQNAVDYELDCRSQIAAQTLLRTIAHHYCDRDDYLARREDFMRILDQEELCNPNTPDKITS